MTNQLKAATESRPWAAKGNVGDVLRPIPHGKLHTGLADKGQEMRKQQRSIWSRIFIKEERLRPTWRVVAYIPILLLTVLALGTVVGLLWSPLKLPKENIRPLVMLLYLAAVLSATYIVRRFLDRRPLRDLGLRTYKGWIADIAVGVGLGALLMALIFAAELAGGWLRVQGFAWQDVVHRDDLLIGLGTALLTFLVVGINEELITRGYILQNLAEDWGMPVAVAVSSILFGLVHLSNPHADVASSINLMVCGVFFAIGYLVTGSLWLPIALHFSWNFYEGAVFGFPVSGVPYGPSMLETAVQGPELITGGAFGPEGGLMGLGATLLGMALLWLWGHISKQKSR